MAKTDVQHDVIVIGAGFAGLVAANRAAQRELQTLVVEGSSPCSSKLLRTTLPLAALAFRSREAIQPISAGAGFTLFDVPFEPSIVASLEEGHQPVHLDLHTAETPAERGFEISDGIVAVGENTPAIVEVHHRLGRT